MRGDWCVRGRAAGRGPRFDAMSNDIAFEELELTFDDLVWLEHNPSITGG